MNPSATAVLAVLVLALPGCLDNVGNPFSRADQPDPYDYISDADYTSLLVEVDYVGGQKPPASALDLLRTRLNECLAKPDGIRVQLGDEIPGGGSPYTPEKILALRDQWKDAKHADGQASAWVVYLEGRYSENQNVLGVTIRPPGDVIAIFGDRVDSASNLLVSSTKIHEAVLVHEFGHLLGLVNNGIPMVTNHEDPDHPKHSRNDHSVMYWAVETTNIVNLLQNSGQIPTRFDSADKADLANAGGRCGNASQGAPGPELPPIPPL